MWGDPKRAASLHEGDHLVGLLMQVSSPAHVPWKDNRWGELLLGCDVWVHTEVGQGNGVIHRACESMAKNAQISSNLAALFLHTAHRIVRLLDELSKGENDKDSVDKDFCHRASVISRAKVAGGSMRLACLLSHQCIVRLCSMALPSGLEEVMTYTSRGDLRHNLPAGQILIDTLLDFLCALQRKNGWWKVPAMYDATKFALQLLIVLCSTQLYQPFVSSFSEESVTNNFALQHLMQYCAANKTRRERDLAWMHRESDQPISPWTPQKVVGACVEFFASRPPSPEGSIAYHFLQIGQAIASSSGEVKAADGLYETPNIVIASKPCNVNTGTKDNGFQNEQSSHEGNGGGHSFISDATQGVLLLSTSVILLPFRFMRLVIGLWGEKRLPESQHALQSRGFGQDVLWISDCPIADLSSCILLLLANNHRNERETVNPFRGVLKTFTDERWNVDEAIQMQVLSSESSKLDGRQGQQKVDLDSTSASTRVNFESLIRAFGQTLHTENADLLLYTFMQASPAFAASLSARSDRDTLVIPLLRNLYFCTSSRLYRGTGSVQIPVQSTSRLYIIIIVVLIFSQDSSFGSDAFRRIRIPSISWYKERQLKDINLGSLMLLCLLRCLVYGLTRLQDPFLLSNCCAILTNLGPEVVSIHEYAAMRLASVTVSVLKRFVKVSQLASGPSKRDASLELEMHRQAVETIVSILDECIVPSRIGENLHLLYALVYHQIDLNKALKQIPASDATESIKSVVSQASQIIQENGGWSASEAMRILKDRYGQIQHALGSNRRIDHFNFSYEEEQDPETFFVPYIWNMIVCTVSSGSLEWDRGHIPSLQEAQQEEETVKAGQTSDADADSFSANIV